MTSTGVTDAETKAYIESRKRIPNEFPQRIVKTEGFERLFSHYTGLHGDELMQYLVDFQNKALKASLRDILLT